MVVARHDGDHVRQGADIGTRYRGQQGPVRRDDLGKSRPARGHNQAEGAGGDDARLDDCFHACS
jgi:hypothetical protein